MSRNPLFSRKICCGGADRLYSPSIDVDTGLHSKHLTPTKLPHWPSETIAVLCTVDEAPYAIPVTAPLRISGRKILLSLMDSRGSLARLRKFPPVALLILDANDLAFTARGNAFVIAEAMACAPGSVAVAIEVEEIDDHRLPGRAITCSAGIDWDSITTQRMLRAHLAALREVARDAGLPDASFDEAVDLRKTVGLDVAGT